MNRIDPKLAATLRQPADLVERGLAQAADLADLERVAARYAVAVPGPTISRRKQNRQYTAQTCTSLNSTRSG